MKIKIFKLAFVVICLSLFSSVYSQTLFKLTVTNMQIIDNAVQFDLFIQATTSEPIYLSTSDFVFSFNIANFTNPDFAYINNSTVLKNSNGLPTLEYNSAITTKLLDNILIINISELNFATQTEFNNKVAKIDNSPLTHKIGRFSVSNISNPLGTFGLQWVILKTIVQSYESQKWAVNDYSSSGTYEMISEQPLPVELESFSASVFNKNNIRLNWTTATEINNSGFDIERKVGEQWEKVGYKSGAGTTTASTNYSFEDTKLNCGKYEYRLKQIDNNGNFHYFTLNSVIEIGLPVKLDLSQNYPNPFNPVTKIDFDLPVDSKVNITIYDIVGREIKSIVNDFRPAGYYTVTFDATGLSSGTYFYRLKVDNDKNILTKKLVVIK